MQKLSRIFALTAALGFALPAVASAQWDILRREGVLSRDDRSRVSRIPPGHLPPRGYCRVWVEGRPPGQQPPVTSCRTAERERARYGSRAYVVYGDRVYSRSGDVYDRNDARRTRVYDRVIDGRRCRVTETWQYGRRVDSRTVCDRTPTRRVYDDRDYRRDDRRWDDDSDRRGNAKKAVKVKTVKKVKQNNGRGRG